MKMKMSCDTKLQKNENDNENTTSGDNVNTSYIVDAIPRHKCENRFNYTNIQLAERRKVLKDLEKLYPHLPYGWIEMMYDFEKNTPKEEIDEIINTGKWETESKYQHPIQ